MFEPRDEDVAVPDLAGPRGLAPSAQMFARDADNQTACQILIAALTN
jgi:hypothetical protein